MTAAPDARPSIPEPARGAARGIAIGTLIVLAVGALAGGISLAARPDGSIMQMPLRLLDGSPFNDYFIPGLILGGLFGVGSAVVAVLGWLNLRPAPFLAFAIGCGQMIWIVVELAIIKEFSILHPICFGMGLAIALASVRWGWPTFAGWRESRG